MKNYLTLAVLLLACSGETEFTNTDNNGDNVEGNGVISFPDYIEFLDLEPDVTTAETLEIGSVGDNNLAILEVRIKDSSDGVFYMAEEEDLSLVPGTTKEITITATLPAGVDYAEGIVYINSNDPDYIEIDLPLRAYLVESTHDTGL